MDRFLALLATNLQLPPGSPSISKKAHMKGLVKVGGAAPKISATKLPSSVSAVRSTATMTSPRVMWYTCATEGN